MSLSEEDNKKIKDLLNSDKSVFVKTVCSMNLASIRILLAQLWEFFDQFSDLRWSFLNNPVNMGVMMMLKKLKIKEKGTKGLEVLYNLYCKQWGVNELYGLIYDKEGKNK